MEFGPAGRKGIRRWKTSAAVAPAQAPSQSASVAATNHQPSAARETVTGDVRQEKNPAHKVHRQFLAGYLSKKHLGMIADECERIVQDFDIVTCVDQGTLAGKSWMSPESRS